MPSFVVFKEIAGYCFLWAFLLFLCFSPSHIHICYGEQNSVWAEVDSSFGKCQHLGLLFRKCLSKEDFFLKKGGKTQENKIYFSRLVYNSFFPKQPPIPEAWTVWTQHESELCCSLKYKISIFASASAQINNSKT